VTGRGVLAVLLVVGSCDRRTEEGLRSSADTVAMSSTDVAGDTLVRCYRAPSSILA
jgi:hypothetical protein